MRRCDVLVERPSLAVCEFGFKAMFEAARGGAVMIPVGFCFTACCPVAVGSISRLVPTRPACFKSALVLYQYNDGFVSTLHHDVAVNVDLE